MSSALQCLSNCYPLTNYFIEKNHIKELINFENLGRQNPLSSEGKMAKHYGYFIKNVWISETSTFSPFLLKTVVGKKNPHFSGYQQQDSSEFLCFLLDGIHEDLNRVLEKPYSEQLDSEDPNEDLLTATKSWYLHKMRNQSIIVDKFHGILKSRLDCDQNCQKISITFYPFLILPLPIPKKKEKLMVVYLVWKDGRKLPVKFEIKYLEGKAALKDLIQLIQSKVKGLKELTFVKSNTSQAFDIYTQDQQLSTIKNSPEQIPESLNFLIEHDEQSPQEKYIKLFLQMCQMCCYSTSTSQIHILEFKSTADLVTIKQAIVNHFRVVLEKVKGLGLSQEEMEKIKAMGNEEFYDFALQNSKTNKIQIQWETNSRGYFNCYFCGKNTCKNCPIDDDKSITLEDIKSKVPYHFDLTILINFDNLDSNVIFNNLINDFMEYPQYLLQEQENKTEKLQENQVIVALEENQAQLQSNKSIWIRNTSNINAALPKSGKSIYDCLDCFESVEQLEQGNEWYCNKCKQHQLVSKQMKIFSAPENLIIQLKRFKQGENILSSNKIKTLIDFPIKDLDLTNYVSINEHPNELLIEENLQELYKVTQKEEEKKELDPIPHKKVKQASASTVKINPNIKKSGKILYDLYGVSNHYGNLGFGHYTAYCKNYTDQKWYEFDDRNVTEIQESQIVTDAAYMLFYQRKN